MVDLDLLDSYENGHRDWSSGQNSQTFNFLKSLSQSKPNIELCEKIRQGDNVTTCTCRDIFSVIFALITCQDLCRPWGNNIGCTSFMACSQISSKL